MAAAAAASHKPHKEDQLSKQSTNKAANVGKHRQQGDKHFQRRQQHVDTVAEQLTCCHLSSQAFTMIQTSVSSLGHIDQTSGAKWTPRQHTSPIYDFILPVCRDATFPATLGKHQVERLL